MLEILINPRKAERRSWEMFFVGLFYASVAILLVNWMFASDPVLSGASGILVVTFTVMFSLPFVFYTIKFEEKKINDEKGFRLLKDHKRAILAFLWLFLGFIVAFAFWQIFLSDNVFNFQVKTYCQINRPANFDDCVKQFSGGSAGITGNAIMKSSQRFFTILINNIYVLIFTLVFSLLFGAGAIFVLAWNASVIAVAVGIFTKSQITALPIGLLRYMIHGIPEIAAYFIVALAGGIISVAVIKHEYGTEKFWEVMQDALNLVVAAVIVLVIAAAMEVYLTPLLF
jgi:uncharacterized membrane protein SpoIIM required for sporulation